MSVEVSLSLRLGLVFLALAFGGDQKRTLGDGFGGHAIVSQSNLLRLLVLASCACVHFAFLFAHLGKSFWW